MTDAERVGELTGLTGTFWTESYSDHASTADLARAVAYQQDELAVKLADARAMMSTDTLVPLYRPRWFPLGRVTTGGRVREYGDGMTYQTAGMTYGQSDDRPTYAGPLPMTDCPAVYAQAAGGGRVWLRDADFVLDDDGWLVFTVDPGVPAVYAFEPDIDLDYVWRAFGFLTRVRERSTADYAEFVRAFVAQAAGNTDAGLRALVGLAFSARPVPADTTVEEVVELLDGRCWVVTPDGTYPTTDPSLVAVGDPLAAGEPADRSVRFQTFRGPVDEPPAYVSLDAGMVLTGPIRFGPGSALAGGGVDGFAAETARREALYGTTLTAAVGGTLPTEPRLLVRESLRYAVTLVTVDRPTAAGTARLSSLRPVMPVHAVLVFDLRLPAVGGGESMTAAESAAIGLGMSTLVDAGSLVGYDYVTAVPLSC